MTRMKRLLLAVAASVFAQGALAGGHSGGHGSMDMKGHDMSGQGAAMERGGHQMSGGRASAAGEPGKASQAARTVEVEMSEFRFNPERIEVKAGETILFRVRNTGKIEHALVFGDAAELKAHAESMRKQPAMAHDDSGGLKLDAAKAGEMVWKFTNAGEFQYGCLVPGHFEAGMLGTVVVNK